MTYNFNYSVVSALFLSITMVFYLRQRRVPDIRNRIFMLMLICGLIAVVFDVFAAVMDRNGMAWPVWLIYLVNYLFLQSLQICLPSFLLYTLILTGQYARLSKKLLFLLMVPFLLVTLFLFASPFCEYGIFYIGKDHSYCTGATHSMLYIATALYMCLSVWVVFRNRQFIQRRKTITVFAATATLFVLTAIQLLNPEYLLTTTATALLLTIMYHVLQSPDEHVDPVTGLFNRSALQLFLQDMIEEKRSCVLLLFAIRDYSVIRHTIGRRGMELLIMQYAAYLGHSFPSHYILHLRTDVFGVLLDRPSINKQELEQLLLQVPRHWPVLNTDVQLSSAVAAIPNQCCSSVPAFLGILDHMVSDLRSAENTRVHIADEAYLAAAARQTELERVIEGAVLSQDLQMLYQPVFSSNGAIAALEATAVIRDTTLGDINVEAIIPTASKTGAIYNLGELFLDKVCAFINHCDIRAYGIPYISVPLPIVLCMQNDLPQRIIRVAREYGVPPDMICFAVQESNALSSLTPAVRCLQALTDAGFRLMLTDFGSGYADFNVLARQPLLCVKLHTKLPLRAMDSPRQQELLVGLIDLLTQMKLPVVCGGVASREQADMLKEAGSTALLGSFYAEPMSETRLFSYLSAGNT